MGSRLSVGHHSFIRPKYLCVEVSTALSESLLRFWRNSTNSVPSFPQDAFMEGPTMAMDQMVDKPENFRLRTGWSGFMAGMMTFVRVLPQDKYDQIMELRRKREGNKPMNMDMPGMKHKNE
jgi:hypothetical protein